MIAQILQWLRGTKPALGTRLSEDEALAIARSAVEAPEADALVLLRLKAGASGPIWLFWAPAVGSHLEVRVDDATGAVIDAKRLGVR